MTAPVVPLPLYTLLANQNEPFAVFLERGGKFYLPLFTSSEDAELYVQRDRPAMQVVRLATLEDACQFIEHPPTKPNYTPHSSFWIILDMIAPGCSARTFDAAEFVRLLCIGRDSGSSGS